VPFRYEEAHRCLSRDGKTFVLSNRDVALVVDVASRAVKAEIPLQHAFGAERTLLSPDGRWLFGSRNYDLIAFDLRNPRQPPRTVAKDYRFDLDFAPDGKSFVVALGTKESTEGKLLALHDAETLAEVKSAPTFGGLCAGVWFTPDGKGLLARVKDRKGARIVLYDAATLEPKGDLTPTHGSPKLSFAPDGKTFIWFDKDQYGKEFLEIWAGGRKVPCQKNRSRNVDMRVACWVTDGAMVAAGNHGFVSLYNATTGKLLAELDLYQAHGVTNGVMRSTAFSPNRRLMASGGVNGEVIFWDLATGKKIGQFQAHLGQVFAMQFSADGRELITYGEEKKLKFWSLGGN
jgi:WD40 repeat protein